MTECIIFVGMQASGKSTYYKTNFSDTHVRVNLDMLKSKKAMNDLIQTCLDNRLSFVIDNTNPMKKTRKTFIERAQFYGYKINCYSFESDYETCLKRNNLRKGNAVIPEKGLLWWKNSFEKPTFEEGFDNIYHVRICGNEYAIAIESKNE